MKRNFYKLLSGAKQGLFALALTVFSGTAYSQTTYTFNYTGSLQTINLTAGDYLIECWGADGGNADNGSVPMSGGKGGYSTGLFTNTTPGIFNVYVGGHGGDASGASNVGGGGGGMSDIAAASNPNLIIIAAGGGGGATSGGASEASTGGDGGGLTGGTAIDGTGVTGGTAATGGSQSAGGSATAGSYGVGNPGGYGYGGGSANGSSNPPSQDGTIHGPGGAGGNGGNGGWNGGGGGCTSTGGNDHAAGGGAGYYGGGGGRGDGGAAGGGSGYVGGLTTGTTAGISDPGFVPNPDVTGNGLIRITQLCDVSIESSSNPVCEGSSVTLTCTAVTTLSWSSTVSTASTIVVTPTSNTTYYVTGIGSNNNCVATAAINISMTPLPDITHMINPSLLCVGSAATLTASGADTYTWSNSTSGFTTAVSPSVTTTYTVLGTNSFGCVNSNTVSVVVNSNAISVPGATTICQNTMIDILASGAVTYIWNNGVPLPGIIVSPTVSTVYSVIGVDANNCVLSNSVSVTVKPKPTVFASTDKDVICRGESVTLSGSGASTYAWSNPITGSGSGASLTLNLNVDVPYTFTVTGTDASGCAETATVSVMVEKCSGLNESNIKNIGVSIYPNPTAGLFTIKSEKINSGVFEIIDLSGKTIFNGTIKSNTTEINMNNFAAGVYFVKVKNETSSEVIKLIKH